MPRPIKVAFLVVDDRFAKLEPFPRFGAAPTALLNGFEALGDELEIHVISCTMSLQTQPQKIAKNIWFHGPMVQKSGFLRTLHAGCILAVRRIIHEIQPDLIHAQGTERWCAVAGVFNKIPKVLTIHGNLEAIDPLVRMHPRLYWKLQTWLQKLTLPRYDGVFCNSSYTEAHLSSRAKHTWKVPNPIRAEFFKIPASVNLSKERVVLLNVGVFQPRKRQLRLLQLAKELWRGGTKVTFRFVGALSSDAYSNECRILLDEGEKYGFAEYGGLKTAAELVEEMDRAHAMIHCPKEEAFGLVVGEGLARGMKIFGTAVGGILDITEGMKSCTLHEMDDWHGMAISIQQWVEEGSPKFTENIRIVRDRYSPQVIAGKHLEIYRELLGGAS